MAIKTVTACSPAASALVAWSEFLEQTGTPVERVRELMELGWLEPAGQATHAVFFRRSDIYRTRKLTRLCEDFEMPAWQAPSSWIFWTALRIWKRASESWNADRLRLAQHVREAALPSGYFKQIYGSGRAGTDV